MDQTCEQHIAPTYSCGRSGRKHLYPLILGNSKGKTAVRALAVVVTNVGREDAFEVTAGRSTVN
jgi:hypothetical protein